MTRIHQLLLPASAALLLTACDRTPSRPLPSHEQAATYEVRGVVRKVDSVKRRAVIAHEEIPGYMEAMAMEFAVPNAEDFTALEPGGTFTFRLSVTDARSWIDRVQKIDAATVAIPEPPAAAGLAIGASIPDCTLTDQDGRPFRLRDFRGRTLAITFIFTRCPLPDFCPRMSEQFSAVQQELQITAPDARLLSVTIDPAYDTPERLAAYAKRFGADPARWTFATGEPREIERLASAFGLQTKREGTELNHTLRTVVIAPDGHIDAIFPGNEWKASELVDAVKRAMATRP
jgi:protein SCO1/2